jgi:Glycosyltransferase family 87
LSHDSRSTSPWTAAAIAVAGVAVLLLSSLPPPQRVLSRPDRGDIEVYFDYAQRTFDGQVPYRDFTLEYPPGALPVLLAAAPADQGYYDRFRVLMLALGAAIIGLLVVVLFRVGAGAAELAAGVLVPATLPFTLNPSLVVQRYDFWPAALVLLALAALLRGRRTLGLAALGVGVAAKLYPIAVVPLAILTRRGRAHWLRELAVVAAAALVLVVPFAVVAPRGVGHVGWLLLRRPLHVESLGGSILLVAHRLGAYDPTVYLSIGQSWDLAGPAAKVVALLGSLAETAALVAVWLVFARGPRGPRELLLAVAAAVVGFVAFGKIFSPQYMLWVAAAVPLALGRVRPFALGATLAAMLLTLYVYDYGYFDMIRGGRVGWMMFARNVILVALFCSLLLELAARGRAWTAEQAGRT